MTLIDVTIRDRINACWMGKSVGGTLGVPFEGKPGPHDVWFYTPVPTQMLPNDDLDLQVVWAVVLTGMQQPAVDRHTLAAAWLKHVDFPWDEYGVARRNLTMGLRPPATGSYDNWFANSMGAAIRTELWACLAPGDPAKAAAYAYEDACVDHDGEGVWSAVFFAALQSMAFVESDPATLIERALEQLPTDCQIYEAIRHVQKWCADSDDWLQIRAQILELYDHPNFTDVTANVAFTVMAWLISRGDFSQAICIANNCGRDTDCTAATVGALMGIIDPTCIPDRWVAPIGQSLVLSPQIVHLEHPADLAGLTDLILDLQPRLKPRSAANDSAGQKTDHLYVPARIARSATYPTDYATASALLAQHGDDVRLAGSCVDLPNDSSGNEAVVVRYHTRLPVDRQVQVMCNTASAYRMWINGAKVLDVAAGGILGPSFHRQAIRTQSHQIQLEAGTHEIVIAIMPESDREIAWIFGIGDPDTRQWLPELLYQDAAGN